jgi:two-component system phosphate regulon sensor histidine kinase PhoR
MRLTGRLILGGATLFACGLACTAAGVAEFRANQVSLLWPLLAGGWFVVATAQAIVQYMVTTRNGRRLRMQLTHREAEVRELHLQLKIAQAERQYSDAILHSISDAVLVTDTKDELVLANESAALTFKFDTDCIGPRSLDQALADPGMIALIRDMREANDPQARKVVEHNVSTAAGERTLRVTLSNFSKSADAPAGVVAVCRDITEEKDVAEVKNDFVSMVSHELRTPLACIKAYVEMLIDGEAEDSKTQHEFYEVIQNEANRLGRLIDNILNISRIEAGLISSTREPQDLAAILNDAIEVIRPQVKEKNITLTTNVMASAYRTLADRDMLFQAVLNLLSNAVKYTPAGRSIDVETGVDLVRKTVFTKIIDTGVGIPPKDMPYVFDKFYRAEANNRIAPGTGLGLALVRHIIEMVHNGRMLAQSCVGKGSCFGFELDLCEKEDGAMLNTADNGKLTTND